MADPFAAAIVAQFHAPGSDEARYTPNAGAEHTVRTIIGRPDRINELTQGKIVLTEIEVSLLQSEVPAPGEGDQLEIIRDGAVAFVLALSGEPMSDVERLSWTIGATEV